jgi:hypothetical protein
VVGWYGEAGVVIDAELSDRQPPASLVRRHGAERFWERWTAAECRAKLADVPIIMWLHRHGLDEGPGEVVTRVDVLPGVTLSVACVQPPG